MSRTLIDPYADVVLSHTLFDWSDPTLDADSIGEKILGHNIYYDEEEYRQGSIAAWDERGYTGLRPLEIETKILFEAGRNNWAKNSKWGKPLWQHMLTLIKLLFPETHITPSLADATMFFMLGFGGGNKKILNLIGSLSSGKSASAVRIAFACAVVDVNFTAIYVANPFDNAASSTVYGDVEELWDQLIEYHPNRSGKGFADCPSMFPYAKKFAASAIDFVPGVPKAARIELRNIKHVGKFKGTKSRGGDVDRGVILVIIDEVNEIDNLSFLTTLTNIASQDAFFCITSQNFKSTEDLGGQITEPVDTYGGPASFEELNIDEDVYWHSKASSITLRFDGLKSPNILAKRDIYPKLFRQKDLDRISTDYGVASPDYASQVRSFPQNTDSANTVLSKAKINNSRHKDEHFTVIRHNGAVSFADPAFGGRDKALWGFADMVTALTRDAEGNQKEEEILLFREHFRPLKLTKDAVYNEWWMERLKKAGMDIRDFTLGADVSFEDQIAIQCRELNQQFGIRTDGFGYDFSMRPTVVSSFNQIIGFGAVAYDYNGGPKGCMLENIKQDSIDCCKDRVTELAFLAADYFLTKQIRGGSFIETATLQLSRTQYETVAKKYVAEKKKEFKARYGGASPDARDVLMGICSMAHSRGFRTRAVTQGSNNGKSTWAEINARGIGQSKVGKRL